jgi:YD repeat-containing protein
MQVSCTNLINIRGIKEYIAVFEYNTDNKLAKQTDAEGKVSRYEYDSEGRLVKTLDGNNNEIVVEYEDDSGSGCSSCSGGGSTNQPSRVVYPTFEKTFAYDERGRKVSETDVLSDTESYVTGFAYDDSGNLASKTDKEEKVTTYEYDYLNRLVKVTNITNETNHQ